MRYSYNKDEIKNGLDELQIKDLLSEWGGEPISKEGVLVSRTICHNKCGCGSHKLYFYMNTGLFKCYTDCGDEAFDIFELTRKVMSREAPKARENSDWNLPEAIDYIARRFGFSPERDEETEELSIRKDLTVLEKYDRIKDIDIKTQEVELKEYDDTYLKHMPHHVKIQPWLKEDISQEVIESHGICYDPKNCGIIIPHYDMNNRLIGIRERTLIKEQAELYGKYMPARIGGTMFNHPLSFNLYNLNWSKENIKRIQKVFVFEAEKSCLKYASYFGEENDISVAICGSSFVTYQASLLASVGVKEIIVALDRQYQELGDKEFKKLVKNLKNIHKKYGNFITISFLFDKKKRLEYKASPIDQGKELFLELYKERINLY